MDKREFALTAFGKASAKGGGRSTKRATSMNMASSVLKSANRSRSPDLPIPSRLAADVDPATTPATLPPADVAAITEGLQAITTQLGAMSAWQQEVGCLKLHLSPYRIPSLPTIRRPTVSDPVPCDTF